MSPRRHVEWQASSGASYVPSIVYYEGLLYMTNEVGVVTCADARTGETVWRHRLGGVFFASPVAGDGKVYLVSETGETFVLRAGRTAGGSGAKRARRAVDRLARDLAGAALPAQRRHAVRRGEVAWMPHAP